MEARKTADLPTNFAAQMPEVYRLWRQCQRSNALYWTGGYSDQPHILMMEFAVCASTFDKFQAAYAPQGPF